MKMAWVVLASASASLPQPAVAAEKTAPITRTVVLEGKTYTIEQKGKWARSRFHGGVVVSGGVQQVDASVRAAEIATGCRNKGYTDRNVYVDVLLDCENSPEAAPKGTVVTPGRPQ